jgi:hypothetical protein
MMGRNYTACSVCDLLQASCLYERSADLTDGAILAHAMNAPGAEQRLNASCILLYGRLLGLPAELAEHIYLSRTLYHAPQGRDTRLQVIWLLLMAHELVHVRQARTLSAGPLRPLRFGLWAGLRYARSFLRHGRRAYAEAAFEREAESGRDALKELLKRTGGIHPQHPIVAWCMEDRQEELRQWLAEQLPG